jgi:hypothetical protein
MGAVFVSYRRGDSEGQARALSLELVKLLGKDSVFMDVDSIGLGHDFRHVLQERLGSCDVMIALIGPGWLDAKDASGNRRLASPTDLVRQEIAAALKRNIPVIPVLLQGAQMPLPERLPDDIAELSYRNGFELGHSTWESDVTEMVKRLRLDEPKTTASMPPSTAERTAPWVTAVPVPFRRGRVLAAALIAVAVAGGGLLVYFYPRSQDSEQSVVTPLAQPSTGAVAPSSGLAASGLEFKWPGADCWDIFRGERLVTYKCGANQQALEAGTYTIKGKFAAVFMPFDVVIKAGSSTRIEMGGIFEFKWPGADCWDIFRGDQFVTYKCGADHQALEAGTYTIKGKFAPVFNPFQIKVTDGSRVTAP